MSAEAPAPRSDPEPPPAIGRTLSLVRRLIDYGRQLAAAVQQRAGTPGFAFFARPFGTADLAVILARITCGLRRAAALEARLSARAATGQDLKVAPTRLPAAGAKRPARKVETPDSQPATPADDPRLSRLPTEEEIAAEVRRRPIGAVIVDICSDLGIAPGHLDGAFWQEINHAIMMYGGSLVRFLTRLQDRLWAFRSSGLADDDWPGWPGAPPPLPAPATGPP